LDWTSVLCFEQPPPENIRSYLELPNVILECVPELHKNRFSTARQLMRITRKHRPQIVHFHYTGFLTPFPWAVRIAGAQQVYLTSHLSPPEGFKPLAAALWKRLAARTINYPVQGVVCPSRYGRSWLTSLGLLPDKRFQTIYNGTDLSISKINSVHAQQFRQKYKIPFDRQIVAQIGTLSNEKGVLDLLAAATRVIKHQPLAHFVFAGDGPLHGTCKKMAVELGIEGNTTFTGSLQDIYTSGLYEAADVCCLVSRWNELFGFVLIEAMIFERPIVATRVGGIPEVVVDRQTGFLVERGDVTAMSERIGTLLTNAQLRRTLGVAGRQRVVEMFDVRKNVAELIEWYRIANNGNH